MPGMPTAPRGQGTDLRRHMGRRVRINAEELKTPLENRLESDYNEPQMPRGEIWSLRCGWKGATGVGIITQQ